SGQEQMQLRIHPHTARSVIPLMDQHNGPLSVHQRIAAADIEQPDARLLVRDHHYAPAQAIPRSKWRFARDQDGSLVPDAEHVWLENGFEAGRFYDLIYTPAECRWGSAGFVALRDLGNYLRADPTSPVRDLTLIAEGISQCGRFLRHFLHAGMNAAEDGTRCFDGMLIHVAGGRRGEFNHRFAQPSVQPTPSFGHLFPFADAPQTDPNTGTHEGLLDAVSATDTCPMIVYTDTASEYWRGDASLAHTEATSGADVELPRTVRRYLFSGTQHGPGLLPYVDSSPRYGVRGQNLFNTIDYRPLYRAALENLRDWIQSDIEPPPSQYPRTEDGTAVDRQRAIETLSALRRIALPTVATIPCIHPLHLGDDHARGIGAYPARITGPAFPARVSALDADGNEIAGIRMPDISIPLATHTGFAPRHQDCGGAGLLLEYLGSTVPFALDEATRRDTGDPRPSIAERYANRDDYLAKIRKAANELVAHRYLLSEDVDACVAMAAERYDALHK
ncbi:MAG: alpha/beta hydrolase domain-containing protein, partial [Pseudomonadota bacterium]